MEDKQQPVQRNAPENTKQSLTPEELIHRHMLNPDEPITDEDMKNLDVSQQLTPEAKAEADKEADILEKDNTGMSYTADF